MYNPFDGVKPGLGPFGQYLQSPISIGIALIWALSITGAAIYFFPAALSFIRARRSQRPHQAEEALKDMAAPGISLLILMLIPVIYLVIVGIAA